MRLDCQDSEGKSALERAVEKQGAEVVKRLLDSSKSLKLADNEAIISAARRRGDAEVLSAIDRVLGRP